MNESDREYLKSFKRRAVEGVTRSRKYLFVSLFVLKRA